jgi:hypothetical protein
MLICEQGYTRQCMPRLAGSLEELGDGTGDRVNHGQLVI